MAGRAAVAAALPSDVVDRAIALARGDRRTILGIVGTPGAGKSTFAAALAEAVTEPCQVLPMDGFHLAQAELTRLGRAARKGAPDTFDAAGFRALLARVRGQHGGDVVYAPEFRRAIEEPIAGAIAVDPGTRLIITEGNYLLFEDDGWCGTSELLDECWYLEVDEATRLERLVGRHVAHGRSVDDARAWVASTDEPNARRIEATRERADRIVGWATRTP